MGSVQFQFHLSIEFNINRFLRIILKNHLKHSQQLFLSIAFHLYRILWMQLRLVQLYEDNILNIAGDHGDNQFEKETVFELWKVHIC